MGDLPRILAQPNIPRVDFPRVNPGAMGAPWASLAELGAALRERQAPIDAAQQSSDYNIMADDLKNEVVAEGDPSTWRQTFLAREAENFSQMQQGIQDPRVKQAVALHRARVIDEHIKDISARGLRATHANQQAVIEKVGNDLAQQAATTTSDSLRNSYIESFNSLVNASAQPVRIGDKTIPGALQDPRKQEEVKAKFQQKFLSFQADGEIERDPSAFLRNLQSGKYDQLDPDKRRLHRNAANSAISGAIALDNRDQKAKTERSYREIQGMIDQGVNVATIQQRLQADTAAGILDRSTREFFDNKLIRGEKADDPVQIHNAEKLRADFLEAYPTGGRVRDYRERVRSMRAKGEIGDKGAAQVENALIQAESHLNSEGRAQRSEQRAIDRMGAEGGGKMTSAQAIQLIGRNFPNSSPNHPILPGHKQDMSEFLSRSTIGGEKPADVAKDIYTRREKQITQSKDQQKQRAEAAKNDPAAAAILERLKQIKTK